MELKLVFLFLTSLIINTCAWDDNDLEVFDVVEEVNQNFYELLGVQQTASPAEIKSAFKRLTLKLHPDKNDAPDADVQFRNLVSVHNILKDPEKREKYNEVLVNGLPNWRSAVYYYRHARKIGLVEGSIIIFIIITLGQYLFGWSAYLEKRYTAEQILAARTKRQKKGGFDTGLQEVLESLPKPSIKDTLPFQIPRAIWWSITAIPYAVVELKRRAKERELEEKRRKKREKEEEAAREAREAAAEALKACAKKRRKFIPEEREFSHETYEDKDSNSTEVKSTPSKPPLIVGGLWTDDDLIELVRLVKKYPGGTPDRWERIADFMRRPVPEITHMAAKLKDNLYKIPGQEENEIPQPEVPKKVKTRKTEETALSSAANWSQSQQKALEVALAKYPKGGMVDRWEKIAKSVPNKTKEECMQRCKYLTELVKKQKQKEEESQKAEESKNEDVNIESAENGDSGNSSS